MKLDQVDKSKSFTKRLLSDFTKALFELLQVKKLESVTVAELCAKASYPRSTFYNYFEDIYALMDYCWDSLGAQMGIEEFQGIDHDKRTLALFDMVYDFMEGKRSVIDRLLESNRADGAMLRSLDGYIRRTVYRMVSECEFSFKYPVPQEIIARHYSNTVQMILTACFMDKAITKQQATAYMDFLLGTLEKESTRK